ADYAFGSKDAVSAIRTEDLTLSAARVADRKVMPDSVFVYYTVAQPASVADSILNAIKKTNDGLTPMGWTTQEALAQSGMNEFGAAFDLKAGEATVVSLQGGQITAVIKVSETTRPKEKVKLAVLRKTISPSDDTYRSFLMQATELADAADGKYENFSRVVKEKGLPVIPSSRLQLETRRLGACDNARSVVQWAFDRKTKAGSVSDVITVDNKYHFVAAVTKARKEGYAPVSEVSSNIALALSTEKKVAALAEDCKSKISGSESIEAIAEKLGTTVSHRDGISFGMMNMSMDPALIGAVSVADKGVVTGPVKGAAGVCYFVVNEVGEGSYYTEEDAKNRLMQTSSYALQSLPSILAEEAEVKDSRARFY
ncbi:MAG: hypothetical protein HUJ91_07085, partial [Bacteroidales bacterium]|nr:hypothetical protein [Bacteroidales bacterium]